MDDSFLGVSRDEAMMEGSKFLIEGLREKVGLSHLFIFHNSAGTIGFIGIVTTSS